jgi:hypothetical protein
LYSLFLYTVCPIRTKQIEFYENDEVDEESCDSYASADASESDFDFDYDGLVDNLDEIELFDEDLDLYTEKLDSINESYITDGSFTSNSLKLSSIFNINMRSSRQSIRKKSKKNCVT